MQKSLSFSADGWAGINRVTGLLNVQNLSLDIFYYVHETSLSFCQIL